MVTRQDLDAYGTINLWDALRGVPGVDVSTTRAADGIVSIRGLTKENNNRTLILLNGRRALDGFVESLNWESLPLDDVIDYYYTGYGDDNLVAAPVYNPGHKLCYFPSMLINEVIIIKQLDSRPGCSVYCPHTSFDDHTAPDGSFPRRSIETRLLAVFEHN